MDRHGYCTRQAYYPKQEPIQTKEQFCTWQWKNVFFFFLPIQIIQETIKTGLKNI